MNIPLCRLITMPIVKLALKIDVLKIEHAFQMGYKQGEKVFFVSPTNWQGKEIVVLIVESSWGPLQKEKNDRFEKFLQGDPNLRPLSREMFSSFLELFKGEKLNQMLLKFIPFCSHGIHNLIISLKHCFDNFGSIDYILKLKALFGYDYIQDNFFLVNRLGRKFIYSRCPLIKLCSDLIWFGECN